MLTNELVAKASNGDLENNNIHLGYFIGAVFLLHSTTYNTN